MNTYGNTGLLISPVGFGGYRIGGRIDEQEHEAALRQALSSGCNLVDTSTNYGDGESERLIGRVLADVPRDSVVVVSKVGYVQGENQRLARNRAELGRPFSGMTEFSADCWHCISPDFITDQLGRSLERLGIQRLDALLLHNPEYFLKAGGSHREYYERIEAAFRHLETEVAAGRIDRYGVSSNTFPLAREAPHFTSLEVLVEIAERIATENGARHHFEVIQFPFNLFEPEAALEENNAGRTLIDFAKSKGLATMVNRPLNSFREDGMVRLADFPHHGKRDIVGDFKNAMTHATALEAQLLGRLKETRNTPLSAREIAWGHIIRENFERLSDIDTWKSFLAYRARPLLQASLKTLSASPEHVAWVEQYRSASDALFEAVTAYLEQQASLISDRIAGQLDHLCPELGEFPTLSQKVIRLYLSVPGIDCVLVGMRQNPYVEDLKNLMDRRDGQSPLRPISWEKARRAFTELQI
jgi:aryl-alcohol dehydrogenase-like predicted oxidoreductase